MADQTVDGLTRAEWRAKLETEGLSEPEIREILAISFGDVPGDRIDLDENPEYDADA